VRVFFFFDEALPKTLTPTLSRRREREHRREREQE
jgi:hypothetical protein